jgi:DNA-binding MarR family transcriptional regulator
LIDVDLIALKPTHDRFTAGLLVDPDVDPRLAQALGKRESGDAPTDDESTHHSSSADLARRNSVTPASIAEVIADLERSRLIVREQDRAGGRALGARLTPAGADVLQQGRAELQDVEARMLQNLKSNEFSVLRDLLRRCIASIQATPHQAASRRSEGPRRGPSEPVPG